MLVDPNFPRRASVPPSSERLRDQAAPDIGLTPPSQRSLFKTLFAKDKTAEERRALAQFAGAVGSGQNGFAAAFANGVSAFEGQQAQTLDAFRQAQEQQRVQALADQERERQASQFERRAGQEDERIAISREGLDVRREVAKQQAQRSKQADFFSPQFAQDADGNTIAVQFSDTGKFKTQQLNGLKLINSNARGRAESNFVEDLRDSAEAASQSFNTANSAISLIEAAPEGTAFGPGAKALLEIDKARAERLPNPSPELLQRIAVSEAIVSLENEQFVANSGPLKGALSDKEGDRITKIGAGLTDSKQGALFKARARAFQAQRAQERSEFIAEAVNGLGKTPEQAKRLWRESLEGRPDFEDLIKDFSGGGSSSSGTISAADFLQGNF